MKVGMVPTRQPSISLRSHARLAHNTLIFEGFRESSVNYSQQSAMVALTFVRMRRGSIRKIV